MNLVDTFLNSNVFATKMFLKAKPWRGETFRYPLKYAKNTTGGSFSGFDILDTTATNNFVSLAYTPKFYYKTISLPITELSVNNTADKVLDLAEFQIATAAQDMADDIGTLFYSDKLKTVAEPMNIIEKIKSLFLHIQLA